MGNISGHRDCKGELSHTPVWVKDREDYGKLGFYSYGDSSRCIMAENTNKNAFLWQGFTGNMGVIVDDEKAIPCQKGDIERIACHKNNRAVLAFSMNYHQP